MTDANKLRGYGVELVRERALARDMQTALERLYHLDELADVDDFVQSADDREAVCVRTHEDGSIELCVFLPRLGARELDLDDTEDLDSFSQIIEGVSHYVYISERARVSREATQLELEVQAEVDKYILIAACASEFGVEHSVALRERLFECVRYTHGPESERGERYRVANEVARRFTHRLERQYIARGDIVRLRAEARRFFGLGQAEKIRAVGL